MYKHKVSGEIAEVCESNSDFYQVSNCEVIPKRFIENSLDWELVKKDDYEILSFITKEGTIYGKIGCKYYNSKFNFSYDFCLKNFNIHSVKNLTNNEIFTIGDKYFYKLVKKESRTIIGFIIRQNRIWLQNSLTNPTYGCTLEYAEKAKPLFTSQDGIEIYEDDKYFLVSNDFKIGYCSSFSEKDLEYKLFSTRELAQNYVNENKKKYSLNDIETAISQSLLIYSKPFVDKVLSNLSNEKH